MGKLVEAFVRLRRDRHMQVYFLRYTAIGGVTQCIDISLFLTLLHFRVPVEAAVAVGITCATVTHFCLNKYFNFRSHDRPVTQQLGTYLSIGAVSMLFAVLLVSGMTRIFHVLPLLAKFTAVAINFPIGFLCHRHFTFGNGIRGTYVAWRARRLDKQPVAPSQ